VKTPLLCAKQGFLTKSNSFIINAKIAFLNKPVACDEEYNENSNDNDDHDDDDGDVRRAEDGRRGREIVSKILAIFLQVRIKIFQM
jgi:hypothetical protein